MGRTLGASYRVHAAPQDCIGGFGYQVYVACAARVDTEGAAEYGGWVFEPKFAFGEDAEAPLAGFEEEGKYQA